MEPLHALFQCDRIVAIGGGHGLGRVMASLGFLGDRLSGIVATTDDGGSTGRLRAASDCIAWGDLRNCVNQLCADSPNLARVLFEHRFKESGELTGHNLGNLILLAMDHMCVRPLDAINLIRQMLQVPAELFPMSETPTRLAAIVDDKTILGETEVDSLNKRPDSLKIVPEVEATEEVIERIDEAQMILIGPGSFMTSVLPPLLVPQIAEAINRSTALKVFIANLSNEESVVGKLSMRCKLDWMRQMTGIYPDVLLWPEQKTLRYDVECEVVRCNMTDGFANGIHSREALRQSLDDLASQKLRRR